MMGWVQWALAAAAAIAIGVAFMVVSQWRVDAALLDKAKVDLEAAEIARDAEGALRLEAERVTGQKQAELLDMQEREDDKIRKLKARIASMVPDIRECDYGLDVGRLLNDARGYDPLPGAPRNVAHDAGPAAATPRGYSLDAGGRDPALAVRHSGL